MSKFVTISTQIRDVQCLREALGDAGAEVVTGKEVRGYAGRKPVEFAAVTTAGQVGFRKTLEGPYEVVADNMSIPQDFVRDLTQRYARRKVLKEATRAGFNVVEDKVQEDRSLRLVVRKW